MLQKRDGAVVDVLKLSGRELRKIRGGEIAYIFQEPSVSLNPVFRVGEQIAEAVSLHRPDVADPWAEAVELLRRVGIPEPRDRVSRYPHELSGGMQQRVICTRRSFRIRSPRPAREFPPFPAKKKHGF